MTQNQSLRWLEIRFFYVLHEILAWHNDMLDVEELISSLAFLTKYQPARVLAAAVELMQSSWIHPSRDEILCLSRLAMLSRKQLEKFIHIQDKTYYAVMERSEEIATLIRPYLAREAFSEIQKFMDALKIMKGLGL